MELTLDQALQKGVEAHRAGQVQDADRIYTAILTAQPKHPDANHNMKKGFSNRQCNCGNRNLCNRIIPLIENGFSA